MKLIAGYFLVFVSWVVKGWLKVTGQRITGDEYRTMAAEVRRLAEIFHLDHHAVILGKDDGRLCSACGSYVGLVVDPHGLCYPCWFDALKQTQQDLREALKAS